MIDALISSKFILGAKDTMFQLPEKSLLFVRQLEPTPTKLTFCY